MTVKVTIDKVSNMAVYLGVLPFKQWKKRYKRMTWNEMMMMSSVQMLSRQIFSCLWKVPQTQILLQSDSFQRGNHRSSFHWSGGQRRTASTPGQQMLPLLVSLLFLIFVSSFVPVAQGRDCKDLKIGELIV